MISARPACFRGAYGRVHQAVRRGEEVADRRPTPVPAQPAVVDRLKAELAADFRNRSFRQGQGPSLLWWPLPVPSSRASEVGKRCCLQRSYAGTKQGAEKR